MLVDPKSKAGKADSSPHQGEDTRGDPEPVLGTSPHARFLTYLIVTAAICAGAWRLFVGPFGHPEPAPVVAEKVQPLIRAGSSVTVPERSPVRAKLVIEPVAEKDIKRDLVLPAVVEADPGHLIKVAPPLAGRVTQLKVQLGERVECGPAAGRDRLARSRRRLFRLRPRQGAAGARAQEPRPAARAGENRRRGRQGLAAGRNRLRHRRSRNSSAPRRTSSRSASTPTPPASRAP